MERSGEGRSMSAKFPEAVRVEARRLRSKGMSWPQIASEIGVATTTARRMVGTGGRIAFPDRRYTARIDDRPLAAVLMRRIPEDTRSLTARIAGDPLPGRSAADREASP